MEEKETATEEFIAYSILRSKPGNRINTTLVDTPTETTASPEEGVRLIRAFIRINQPELRAAIINLVTQIADVGALTIPVQN
jgi:hypothetical protein